MAYAWPSVTAADVLSGEGACLTGQGLFNQSQALKQIRRMGFPFSEFTTTSGTPSARFTAHFRCPDYARAGVDTVSLWIAAWIAGGGTWNARFRLNDGTNETTSSTITGTNTSRAVSSTPMVCAIPAAMHTAQAGRLILDAWRTAGAGTVSVSGEDLLFNCRIDQA